MDNEKKVIKTDEEWKKELTPEQYRVMREKGTEAPWSGKLSKPDAEGIYHCAACGNPIFSQQAKFESGTGWPSFNQAIPESVKLIEDTSGGMKRTEVVCAKCGAHLGHLFNDAFDQPTGQRYCINAVCLNPRKKIKAD
ncbi:MAG TPA: peptide-methionine (R)-S-oxide reductase MsrB [Candidatus Nanoarchaeia archaeon]|nr:peptide-methionine (R)-S-oxide reductase MsrB [Candidatus Nanoarchaeia archaeon]